MSPPIEFRFDELDSAWSRVVSTLNASRHHNQEKSKVQADLAVTLLTGFLGSGKTTILRHALQHPEGLKIAAVVNDVGEIEVDAHLVAAETSNSLSLANGCVCCVLADDLSDQLEMLARSGDYDAVIIEASGDARPVFPSEQSDRVAIDVVGLSQVQSTDGAGDAGVYGRKTQRPLGRLQ